MKGSAVISDYVTNLSVLSYCCSSILSNSPLYFSHQFSLNLQSCVFFFPYLDLCFSFNIILHLYFPKDVSVEGRLASQPQSRARHPLMPGHYLRSANQALLDVDIFAFYIQWLVYSWYSNGLYRAL